MSNTAEVTPYSDSGSSNLGSTLGTSAVVGVGAGLVAAGGVLVACAKFLSEETEQDVQAKEHYKQQRREERLAAARLSCVNLHLKDTSSLLQAAHSLGYRVVTNPTAKPQSGAAPVLLQDLAGHKLALQPVQNGVAIAGNCGIAAIHEVVRQHAVDAVRRHLGTKWLAVKSRQLAGGNVEFEAKEASTGQAGGAATIKAQIDGEGRVHVDIDNVKGNRCEKVLSELSKAVGGKASIVKKKPAYWLLPGEPAKVKV